MDRNNTATKRMTTMGIALILASITILGLARFNELMDVRYQAVGRVMDNAGRPVPGVQAVLQLEPPPPDGPQLDKLFEESSRKRGGSGSDGPLAGDSGPVAGLSDATGRVPGPDHGPPGTCPRNPPGAGPLGQAAL